MEADGIGGKINENGDNFSEKMRTLHLPYPRFLSFDQEIGVGVGHNQSICSCPDSSIDFPLPPPPLGRDLWTDSYRGVFITTRL